MSNVENLASRLDDLLKRDNPAAITLSGKWGVGKTHFWRKFCKERLSTRKVAYISLFGHTSLSEIKADISIQVASKMQKGFDKFIKRFKPTWYGIDISAVLSMFIQEHIKESIVCFDDFERLSDKLALKDVLGLIAALKEQSKCQVVMILNQGELPTEDQPVLSQYKDKTVDYEFEYDPTPAESFGLVKGTLKVDFHHYPPLNYFEEKQINNIRIMQRVINALNDFAFIAEQISDYPDIEKEIVGSIVIMATINAQNLSVDFDDLTNYMVEKSVNSINKNQGFEPIKEYENILGLIVKKNPPDYFFGTDIPSLLIEYNRTSTPDEERMNQIIQEMKDNADLYGIYKRILTLRDDHVYDMYLAREEYVSDIWNIIKEHGDRMLASPNSHFDLNSMVYHIMQLEGLDQPNKAKYHQFGFESIKRFFDNNPDNYHEKMFKRFQKPRVEEFDARLIDYYEQIQIKRRQQKFDSRQKVLDFMSGIVGNRGFNDDKDEIEALSLVEKSMIKQYILEDKQFLRTLHEFLCQLGNQGLFIKYINNAMAVLRDLSNSDNPNHQYKAKNILKDIESEMQSQTTSHKILSNADKPT